MLNIVTKAITTVFGSKSDRDLKQLLPYVEKINAEWFKINKSDFSDEDLRKRSQEIREQIQEELKEIDQEIKETREQAEALGDLEIDQKEELFNHLDKLEEKRNESLEVVLMEVLPVAFAVVKETAFRFKENKKIEVQATFMDKQLAASKEHVEIQGEKAIWHNRWIAAGTEITWNMLHYDVQLIGGIVLHQGKIAEMATGEGKTLVATLPAFLNALANRGVHIVTVNDYLARRDSEWMAPIFEFHGMTVDCIDRHQPNTDARRQAYQADITYGTNNEFGFDYLRDNMADGTDKLVQGRHHYAMIDEVDSVLVDEARTPLIISGPVPQGDQHEYLELKPRISRLVEVQRKYILECLNEAKRKFKAGNLKEAGLPLFRAHRGMPKLRPLIKFLGESGVKVLLQKTENFYLQDNQRNMPEADEPLYFTIDEKNNQIDLTDKGIDFITGSGDDHDFFILPDVGTKIAALENNTELGDREKLEKKEQLLEDYSVKSSRIHSINQLLKAYTLFEKEVDYIIVDNEVRIVDEQTGRVMHGRRYSDGLHQALEAKENVKIQDATQTYATITLQNYFRMYHKLAGMTGTAETEAGEFWEIYKLDVVVIPTNVPIQRDDREDLVYKTMREKYNAVVDEITALTEEKRPVLVGTTSVENSELLSRMLNLKKIKHQVLNAKLHQKEADIVAEAGKAGTVTIATNMAGRGTDIKLTAESKEAGGLAIIGTERHESRRVDRQLRGRAGRQGDPGSSQFFVSLEDNLMRLFGTDRMAKVMDRIGLKEGEVIQHSMITKSISRAQKKVEENNFGMRKRLLEYDDVMNSQREIIYKRRHNALFGERLQLDILNTFYETCEDTVKNYLGPDNYENFKLQCLKVFGIETLLSLEDFEKAQEAVIIDHLYEEVIIKYREKNQFMIEQILPAIQRLEKERGKIQGEIRIDLTDGRILIPILFNVEKALETKGREIIKAIEKSVTLRIIDHEWKEHLREMDDLKQSVRTAQFEQKDPLIIYKFEGYELFSNFVAKLNTSIVPFLMKAHPPLAEPEPLKEARRSHRSKQKLQENKAAVQSSIGGGNSAQMQTNEANTATQEKVMPKKADKGPGRNDRVTVQYSDGRLKKDVKYKTVEQDIKNNKCILVEK